MVGSVETGDRGYADHNDNDAAHIKLVTLSSATDFSSLGCSNLSFVRDYLVANDLIILARS